MSYTPNVPQATQTFAQTQQPIADNFSSANTFFGVDHVSFTAAGDNGKHKQMQFVSAASPAAPTGTQSVMYPGNFTGTAYASQIGPFFQNASTTLLCGFNAFVRFIGSTATVVSKYGVFSVVRNSVGNYTITWGTNGGAVALPSANYSVQITASNANAVSLSSVTAASLTFVTQSTSAPIDSANINVMIMGA